jgi:pimeloyl-ACP methyl ester carboxylesterase
MLAAMEAMRLADANVPMPLKAGDPIEATDYCNLDNWLQRPQTADKPVDVFYIYPTSWLREPGNPFICELDNPMLKPMALGNFARQATAFLEVGNVYAPLYRQIDAMLALTVPPAELEQYLLGIPYTDVVAAFEHYLEHYNQGRPYILAGHSQGSSVMRLLLTHYMKEHPSVYERMIAAYMPGYAITQADLDANPSLKFAGEPSESGVILSWNAEAPGLTAPNAVTLPGALTVNPISWTTTADTVPASQNAASRIFSWELLDPDPAYEDIEHLADATINSERGTLVVSGLDEDVYGLPAEFVAVFGPGSYHGHDYSFFYHSIKANAALRAQTYLATH